MLVTGLGSGSFGVRDQPCGGTHWPCWLQMACVSTLQGALPFPLHCIAAFRSMYRIPGWEEPGF